MPVPSELDPVHLRVGTRDQMSTAVTRSHLPDGRVVGWYGPVGTVVDAEPADAAVPPALGAVHGERSFWARWTRAECVAKLLGVPIAVWSRRHGLDVPPEVETLTTELDGLVVSLARLSSQPSPG